MREENNGDVIQLTYNGSAGGFVRSVVYFDTGGVILGNSFNIASVTRIGVGRFDVVFTDAMADANYVVITGYDNIGNNRCRGVYVYARAAAGFTIQNVQGNDNPVDLVNNIVVYRV